MKDNNLNTGLLFKKIPSALRTHLLFTTPVVAILLATPLCIIYQADWRSYVAVSASLMVWGWSTWVVVLATAGSAWMGKIPRWVRMVFEQLILFILAMAFIFVLPYEGMHGLFPHVQLLILVLTISLSFNLMVHTIHDLTMTREDAMKLNVENAALRYARLQAEFERLKEQINPHFLFNALNTSKSLVRENPVGAERYIIHLSDFLRSTIQQHEMMVTLAEEMAMCHNYMELQRIRFGNALQFRQAVDHERLRMRIPYFALTTLVENAIKHNALTSEHPVVVDIISGNDEIMVVNNIRPKPGGVTTGIGLTNLDERCRLLTGAPISVTNDGSVYSVRIKLTPP